EKLPLFLLSLISSLVTLYAQQRGGAVSTLDSLPLDQRLLNAGRATLGYLQHTLWPTKLAAYYPYHPITAPALTLPRTALLALISALPLWQRRRAPHLFVGWFWFVITLLPVVGIVQVGGQAMADRYTYLPGIGLVILIAWSLPDLAGRPRLARLVFFVAAAW